jgi:hypothetical protein
MAGLLFLASTLVWAGFCMVYILYLWPCSCSFSYMAIARVCRPFVFIFIYYFDICWRHAPLGGVLLGDCSVEASLGDSSAEILGLLLVCSTDRDLPGTWVCIDMGFTALVYYFYLLLWALHILLQRLYYFWCLPRVHTIVLSPSAAECLAWALLAPLWLFSHVCYCLSQCHELWLALLVYFSMHET